MKSKRLSWLLFVLMIGLIGLTGCGESNNSGSGVEQGATPREFRQEIRLEGPLPPLVSSRPVKVPVSVRNTSNFTWSASGDHPVRFAYHWFDKDGKKVVHDGERTLLAEDLPAGATAQLNATVVGPPTPGDYTIRFTLVQEGIAWFDDQGAKPVEMPAKVDDH